MISDLSSLYFTFYGYYFVTYIQCFRLHYIHDIHHITLKHVMSTENVVSHISINYNKMSSDTAQ